MKQLFTSPIGRLRLLAIMEGISLLTLVFVAVPMKHYFGDPSFVKSIGPIHGALFLLFVFNAVQVGIAHQWKFRSTTWKVLVACFIPFGTFYIDYSILRKLQRSESYQKNG